MPATIYCLCGREFPQGKITRPLYMTVYYAEDRCPKCVEDALIDAYETVKTAPVTLNPNEVK